MAESIRSRAKRYSKGQFNKNELLTIVGLQLADKAMDIATFGQVSKLQGKAIQKLIIPPVSFTGRLAGQAAIGAGRMLGSSAIGAAAPIVTNPYVAGTALGLGALASPQGQALLEAAEERGRMDRIRAEQYLTDVEQKMGQFRADPIGYSTDVISQRPSAFTGRLLPGGKKRKSSYNTAVSKAMKAIKKSTSYGKKGVLNSPKKAFGFVAKTVSKLRKGKKVSSKGASGVVKRALPGISKIQVRK
jgi:hypothetical protein